ncbi:hypothetical protein [Faecalibacterium sp. An122]|uniref:hypothetical protein n=1 Tax=Faecalibacterium sp. An122 TaxID=1965551 RepID=UPI000B390A85|nr:hypothetical protein [Faecalibacterium sp. An122]OUQ34140.1 hypothetical protein B5E67_13805 [Faecalibacterium sp. An122]
MQIRKWLALLVSAALALSLLAGCGGGKALSQVILDLLDGQYANVAVEIDPDLEADLRQAVHEGETEEEIRAALEKILGSGVSFRLIGDGQQGDSAWNLILYPGNDPAAAARSAFTEWNKVFGSLPRDGQYSAGLAMLETENGYAILVQATVEQPGSRDDGPDDLVVKGTGFTYNVTKKTITVELDSKGMQELFFSNPDTKVEAARNNGFEDIIITLKTGTYSVNDTFKMPFKGTLQGESGATITLTGGSGLFAQIADDGTVENLNITVADTISNGSDSGKAGAVAGVNNGTISGCTVTIDTSGSVSATGDKRAGGIAGWNKTNTIEGTCTVTDVFIEAGASLNNATIHAGGIVGTNESGSVSGTCTVSNCKINAQSTGYGVAYVGGIAGFNYKGSVSGGKVEDGTTVSATCGADGIASAGGIVGYNSSLEGVDDSSIDNDTCTITATDGEPTKASDEIGGEGGDPGSGAFAGTKIGYQAR